MTSKIEQGCMAIITRGDNAGKVVIVGALARPHTHFTNALGQKVFWDCDYSRWNVLCNTELLLLKADGEGYVKSKQGMYCETMLMRIDGKFDETDADICDDLDNYSDLRKLRAK